MTPKPQTSYLGASRATRGRLEKRQYEPKSRYRPRGFDPTDITCPHCLRHGMLPCLANRNSIAHQTILQVSEMLQPMQVGTADARRGRNRASLCVSNILAPPFHGIFERVAHGRLPPGPDRYA